MTVDGAAYAQAARPANAYLSYSAASIRAGAARRDSGPIPPPASALTRSLRSVSVILTSPDRVVPLREGTAGVRQAHCGIPGRLVPLAEHATLVQAARLLCYQTLWLRQEGRPHTAEAAMCKWWAPLVAKNAIEACLLTHGHYGWSDELPFQQRFRDVFGYQIGDGTAQLQKQVIASRLLGPEARGRLPVVFQVAGQELGQVRAGDVGELVELGAAGEPVGQHQRVRCGVAYGGQQGGLGHGP